MKTILSTLIAVGVLTSAAYAQKPTFDPFNDPSLALPRSEMISTGANDQVLSRSGVVVKVDRPFPQDIFPDTVISHP
jgi:hypothetical protein